MDGASLKKYRVKLGLTQLELAGEFGITDQFLSSIERGKSNLPPKHYPKASKLFKISMRKLLKMSLRRHAEHILSETKS